MCHLVTRSVGTPFLIITVTHVHGITTGIATTDGIDAAMMATITATIGVVVPATGVV